MLSTPLILCWRELIPISIFPPPPPHHRLITTTPLVRFFIDFPFPKVNFPECAASITFRLRRYKYSAYLSSSLPKFAMGGDGKGNKLRMGGLCCSVHRNNGLSDSMPFSDFVFYL